MMSNLFWLSEAQMERLNPFFPKSHGKPRVDDRRVLSGIIFINRNGLRWCDAPREYGPAKLRTALMHSVFSPALAGLRHLCRRHFRLGQVGFDR